MEYKHRDTVLIVDSELLDALYGVVDAVAKDQNAMRTAYAKEFRNLIEVQDSHNPELCKKRAQEKFMEARKKATTEPRTAFLYDDGLVTFSQFDGIPKAPVAKPVTANTLLMLWRDCTIPGMQKLRKLVQETCQNQLERVVVKDQETLDAIGTEAKFKITHKTTNNGKNLVCAIISLDKKE